LIAIKLVECFLQLPNDSPAKQPPVPNDGPASTIKQLSVPHDGPAHFKQLSVPYDIPAITTPSFKQLNVPTIATLIDPRTCDNSLSFYFNIITATSTARSTFVSATTTAQMNSSVLNPATHATSLFLLRDEDNSEIMTPSLLLPFNQDNPAITTATHAQNLLLYAQIGSAITTATHAQNLLLFFVRNDPANSKLHLIVAFIRRASTAQTYVDLISVSEGEHLNTPATIRNDSFKLIDTLASEGARFAQILYQQPSDLDSSQLIVDLISINQSSKNIINSSFKPQKLIVIYSKRSLHFREDCGIFCEGEWEQQRHLDGHTGLVDFIGLVGLIRLIGLVDFIGDVGLVGLNGCTSLIDRISLVSLSGLIGHISFIGLSIVGFVGLNLDSLDGIIGLVGFGLNGLDGFDSIIGIVGFIGLGFGLVGHTGLVGLISLDCLGLISLVGLGLISLVIHIGLIVSPVGHVDLGGISLISLIGLVGLEGLISLISHISLVGIGFNGSIGIGIIVVSLRFEIGTKQQYQHYYSLVRESWLWSVRRVLLSTLARLDSDLFFRHALQYAKQLFLSRLSQMTKYCVMRECDNIHSWISLSGDLAFSHQDGIYGFKFPKRFLEISSRDLTSSFLFSQS
jgi:hypothetical protein